LLGAIGKFCDSRTAVFALSPGLEKDQFPELPIWQAEPSDRSVFQSRQRFLPVYPMSAVDCGLGWV